MIRTIFYHGKCLDYKLMCFVFVLILIFKNISCHCDNTNVICKQFLKLSKDSTEKLNYCTKLENHTHE